MKNKVAPDNTLEGSAEDEVRQGIQHVMESLATSGPSDEDVEYDIKECMGHVEIMKALQKADEKTYGEARKELQLIASGKKQDPTLSQAMAESILLELNDVNPVIDL